MGESCFSIRRPCAVYSDAGPGAQATDVVILVVAADDGVMPQTIEANRPRQSREVRSSLPSINATKPEAQLDRIRHELVKYDLIDEHWGGKTIIRNISAKTGEGVAELMELLVLESEMLELKANPNKRARGAVVESELSKGQGPVAWVLVQTGTLHVGDIFLAGETFGRVRALINSRGENVEKVLPATPALVLGFNDVATAGDQFVVVEEERNRPGHCGKAQSARQVEARRDSQTHQLSKISITSQRANGRHSMFVGGGRQGR